MTKGLTKEEKRDADLLYYWMLKKYGNTVPGPFTSKDMKEFANYVVQERLTVLIRIVAVPQILKYSINLHRLLFMS